MSDNASKCPNVRDPGRSETIGDDSSAGVEHAADPVETALADALTKAAAAGQWTTVEVLSRELEARRKARAGVVSLDAERSKRERGG